MAKVSKVEDAFAVVVKSKGHITVAFGDLDKINDNFYIQSFDKKYIADDLKARLKSMGEDVDVQVCSVVDANKIIERISDSKQVVTIL